MLFGVISDRTTLPYPFQKKDFPYSSVWPRMHLINTPLFYREDHLCGLSSNMCTDHRFFSQRSPIFQERAG